MISQRLWIIISSIYDVTPDGSVTSNVISSSFRVWLEDLIDSHTFFASFEAGMLHNRFLRALVTSIILCYVLWEDFQRTRVDRRTFFASLEAGTLH